MGLLAVLLPVVAIGLLVWYVGPRNIPDATSNFLRGVGRFAAGWRGILLVLAGCLLAAASFAVGMAALWQGVMPQLLIAWSITLICLIGVSALLKTAHRPLAAEATCSGDAHFCDERETAAPDLFGQSGIPIGAFLNIEPEQAPVERPLFYAGDRHLIAVSPSRGGKGATAIIPALLSSASGSSAVIIDPKGQNAAVTARRRRELGHKVILLNPLRMHAALFKAQGFRQPINSILSRVSTRTAKTSSRTSPRSPRR